MVTKKTNDPILTSLLIIVALNVFYFVYSLKLLIYISIILGVSVLISSKVAFYIDKVWMGLAKILSYIVPNIILTIIFYFFLYPLSVFSRFFRRKDLLNLKRDSKSLWIDHKREFTREYFQKTW